MAGLNLELINQKYISIVVPRTEILIYTFAQQVTIDFVQQSSYNLPILTNAHVELANNQELKLIQGLNLTSIYKKFYIQSDTITGINRNLENSGDYIVMNNLRYNIIYVPEKFNTGWTCVIAVETALNE